MTKVNYRTRKLTQIAMLGAIIILMSVTPLGYLRIGPLSITFLTIPVVIGSILVGSAGGAILGLIFGLTSFVQCFGMDPFGTALAGINLFYTAVMCLVPRILIGLFAGLAAKGFEKTKLNAALSYAISAFCGAATNTVFFVGFLILFFGNSDYIRETLGDGIMKIIGGLVTTNSLIEALVCAVVAAAVARACTAFLNKKN